MHFLIGFMFASDAIDKFLVSVSTKIMIINREIGSGPRWEEECFPSYFYGVVHKLRKHFWGSQAAPPRRQPIAVSDISLYICLINIRNGSCKPVYGGVDRLKALSSAKTGCRSRFFMN